MQLTHGKPNGFTLIEIIMVVVIIGLMAIFVIPNYNKSIAKSYERAGNNNLTIIYSAQKIKYNGGSGYQAAADTSAVNAALSLGIIGNGMDYSCTCTNCAASNATFTCSAARTGGSFTLRITDSASTVCCSAGSCPSVAGC